MIPRKSKLPSRKHYYRIFWNHISPHFFRPITPNVPPNPKDSSKFPGGTHGTFQHSRWSSQHGGLLAGTLLNLLRLRILEILLIDGSTVRNPVKRSHQLTKTWPMAKRLNFLGLITYLVGKISRSDFFFQGPGRLSELRLVIYPIIYQVLAPSKRWLGMGFLNHQQYHQAPFSAS